MTPEEEKIIEIIIDKSDERKHNRQLKELLWGVQKCKEDGYIYYEDNAYSKTLKDVIRILFSKIDFNTAYSYFAAYFQGHLEDTSPETLRGIKDLKKWLKETGKNYANSIRDMIEDTQIVKKSSGIGGINGPSKVITFNESYMNPSINDDNDCIVDDDKESLNEEEDDNTNDDTDDITKVQDTIAEGNPSGEETPEENTDLAEWRYRYYLSKINNETYQDLIEAIMIKEVDRRELAKEYGWDEKYLNTQFNRAWNAFISVALYDIRHCAPHLFKKYEYHKDMDDDTVAVLHDFFDCRYDIRYMARVYGKNEYGIKLAIVTAYKKLLKIHKKETELLDKENHQYEKKQKRMQRLFAKYKKFLGKNYGVTYWLLNRYFNDCNGDFDEMVKIELANNRSPKELGNKLERAYEILNKLDKEYTRKDENKRTKNND